MRYIKFLVMAVTAVALVACNSKPASGQPAEDEQEAVVTAEETAGEAEAGEMEASEDAFPGEATNAFAEAEDEDDSPVFIVVEEMPMEEDEYKALISKFRVNVKDVDPEASRCRVLVKALVEKDASISKYEVFRSSGNDKLDAYALQLVKDNLKQCSRPALQNDQPVRYSLSIPVSFVEQ